MNSINKLSKDIINLIAAGEVVERPASALKELLENSIDAKATKIIVNLEDYGNSLIEVEDNGIGITKEDSYLALEQHATSKIKTENDLANIYSLGFRGEALASISSVAEKITIVSKNKNSKAFKLINNNNDIIIEESSKDISGTKVSVHGLFNNVPARKKFLKSGNVELKHLNNTFINTSLPFLNIHFELYHNQKLIYKLSKTSDLKTRLFEAFGKNVAKNVNITNANKVNGIDKITAAIGNTFLGRKDSKFQYIFINNRFIKSNLINSAVQNAFRGNLHKDLKPAFFLFIELDPLLVDVNVHPRKLEAKFTNEKDIFLIAYQITKKNLESLNLTLKEDLTFNESAQASKLSDSLSSGVFTEHKNNNISYNNSYSPKTALSFTNELYKPASSLKKHPAQFNTGFVNENKVEDSTIAENSDLTLDGTINPVQLFNTYIFFEKDGEAVFIDQHAAAEKIMFEKLIKQAGQIKTKPLLIPEIIEFKTQAQKKEFKTNATELNKLGFIFEDFGQKSIQIIEVPEGLDSSNIRDLLSDFEKSETELDIVVFDEILSEYNLTKSNYLKLASIACHSSIRAGQRLHNIEMQNIISDLKDLKTSYTCPHGRPIIWKLSKYEIEKNFNRDI